MLAPQTHNGERMLLFTLLVLVGCGESDGSGADSPDPDDDCRSNCCMVCDNGQACGDACIDASLNCQQIGGCACDPDEVCDTDWAE